MIPRGIRKQFFGKKVFLETFVKVEPRLGENKIKN